MSFTRIFSYILDSTDAQNCSAYRCNFMEDNLDRPHPRDRINSGLYKINMDNDEDDDNDELFVIKMSESFTK